jgi:hypothetical protein
VKGGTCSCYFILCPFKNPRSPRMSPLGLDSLKRKNLPIVVTLGGIGSCYASLALYLIDFYPSYKLCDNRDNIPLLYSLNNHVHRFIHYSSLLLNMHNRFTNGQLSSICNNNNLYYATIQIFYTKGCSSSLSLQLLYVILSN